MLSALISASILIGSSATAWFQEPSKSHDREQGSDLPAKKAETASESQKSKDKEPDTPPVVTKHELTIGEKALKYTASVGMMPIRDRDGTTEAHIFYIAYTLDEPGDRAKRSLMFSFNGGPGSASVWLHMGALGPKRVVLPDDASFPKPPFAL